MKALWNILAWAICWIIVPIGMVAVWVAFKVHEWLLTQPD